MSTLALDGVREGLAAIAALPVGMAVYDEHRRLVLSNPALLDMLGVADAAFHPGSHLAEHIRIAAHSGVLGAGAPDQQAAEILALDFTRPHRILHTFGNGRCCEAHYLPLPMHGLLVCLVETSATVALREAAEQATNRLQTALAGLRIGLAIVGPDRALAFHNTCFASLLGLSAARLAPGTPFDAMLTEVARCTGFTGDDAAFLAEQASLDRAHRSSVQRTRGNGTVLDITSDPLPDGGWTLTVADITPLWRAEDEARRRAGLLDSILQQLPHGVAVYGPDLRVRLVNDVFQHILPAAPVAAGDTQASVLARRADAYPTAPGAPPQPPSPQRLCRDGRTVELRTAPLPDGGHIEVLSDVTALVETQGELARHAALIDSVISHIPVGITVYGPDRTLRLVNEAYGAIMQGAPVSPGETVDEIIDRRAMSGEYGEGDPHEVAESQRHRSLASAYARRRRRGNGTTIDIRTAPLPDGGHISVIHDVTPIVEAEAALGRQVAEMDAMLANIRHGIVLWDAGGRIVASNPVAAMLVGAPPDHFAPGRTLRDVTMDAFERGGLGRDRTAEARAYWLLEQDRSLSHTDQRLTREGRILEVRSDPTPGGGFVTTYTDVTPMREAEDALRLAKSAAEAANTAKSRFLAAMGTELRTPLATIQTELAQLARDAAGSRSRSFGQGSVSAIRVEQACEAADAAAHKLLGLIGAVLDVARLEAGRFDLVDSEIDIPHLVEACLNKARNAAAAAEVTLLTDLPDTLPLIRADEDRLRQALGHLLSNAIRVTPSLGTISIGGRRDWISGDVLLTVADTGQGIPPSELERVFEPFNELAGHPNAGVRAGIGLYISRTLLRAHGGDLMLRSAPGEGTTATLRIPAARVLPNEPSRPLHA